MKPRYCEVPHNPPHSYGDCIRACIATMIDRDDVPHTFDDGNSVEGWRSMRSYLMSKGKNIALFAVDDDPHWHMSENNAGIPYMLMGSYQGKVNHAVVCCDGKIIHNPSYTAMTDPLIEGFYIICVIV